MTISRRGHLIGLLATTLCLLGCGGGGGGNNGNDGGTISRCDPDTFTPNYAHHLTSLLNWSGFPVNVYFIRDANYSTARQDIAIAGFNQWVTATSDVLSYSIVSTQSAANITVRFDPSTPNGVTDIHFSGFDISSADMTVGIKDDADSDVQAVAAHEFGHALGINGHSDSVDDLMYPIHYLGTIGVVTTRDLNTIKTGYCHLFGRSVPCDRPCDHVKSKGPMQTIRIE
jgi:hypothetical protein